LKKPLLLTLGLVLLMVGGYFVYTKVITPNPVSTWDFVPKNALIVYETDQCSECVDIDNSPIATLLEKAALQDKPDSLSQSIKNILRRTGLLVSAHATRKDNFDFIYFIPQIKDPSELLPASYDSKNYRSSSREFNGIKINEIKFEKEVFSWLLIENTWVGSFTPFLIEDVIRTFKSPDSGFKGSIKTVEKLPRITGDGGNIFINLRHLGNLTSLFSAVSSPLTQLLGHSAMLDLKVDNSSLVLNGFSVDSVRTSDYILSIFHNQGPVSFNLSHLISERAIWVNSFGISDGSLFNQDLSAFRKNQKFHLRDSISWLNSKGGTDLNLLYGTIKDEVAECFIESSKHKQVSKVLIIESTDVKRWVDTFTKLSDKLSIDTIFFERYGEFEIREVPVNNLPEKLFWPLVAGFKNTFYTTYKNFILISDEVDELKDFLDDIDDDNTWGKSVVFNKFLETTLLESNFSVYINTPKIWNSLSVNLHPRWKKFLSDNQKLFRSFHLGAVQFSHLNNSYYTSISLNYKTLPKANANETTKQQSKTVVNFQANIAGLHIVKSHVTKNDEILIQDSLNDLSLVSKDGNVLWRIPVGDPIVTDVTQIDFYGNGKLQYFFSTNNALHVIDRLGKYVDPYPLFLPSLKIAHAAVVDYDHSKKYRFLIADESGKLWMYDKEGNNLDGWKPKDAGGALMAPPQHYRIQGKDYILSIRKDGTVYLMTRRGEDIKGSPFQLSAPVSGDHFLERGKSLSDTYFVVVTADGYKVKFSVDGKIQSKETLLKNSVSTSFSLVREASQKSYLVVQKDSKNFNLLDENGKIVVSNAFIGGHPGSVNFNDFGSGNIFITILDVIDHLAYVYDPDGNLMTSPPIETTALGLRPGNGENIQLYYIRNNSLAIQPLN
jgi:hypothetical protein